MDSKLFCDISERNEEADVCSTDMQVFKDSLEYSINLMNCVSLNDSLNGNGNLNDIRERNTIDESHLEMEELSTEEKTRFSNNLKDLKNSFIGGGLQSTFQNIDNYNTLNTINSTFLTNEVTKKISYKYVSKIERQFAEKKIFSNKIDSKNNYFWFAAYDKLIKLQNIKKIFDFFGFNKDIDSKEFKEQTIILKNFEIYFDSNLNFSKPFIRAKKDSVVFLKLYYLSIEAFNKIYNYINKTECEFLLDDFIRTNNPADLLNITKNSSDKFKSTPYSTLLCLGSFMNTNIFTFTRNNTVQMISPVSSRSLNETHKEKVKGIVKLIKYLKEAFPQYSDQFFMFHLYSRNGINSGNSSNSNDKSLLQIDLTEIKSKLEKKKLKNIELKEKASELSKKNTNGLKKESSLGINMMSTNNRIKKESKSLMSLKIEKTHLKNISNPSLIKKFSHMWNPNSTGKTYKQYTDRLNKILSNEENDICNNEITPPKKTKNDPKCILKSNYNQNNPTTNSKIYVVSRDSNLRFKTEVESLESSIDSHINLNSNEKKGRKNITLNDQCYNTPTKRKILRYYS